MTANNTGCDARCVTSFADTEAGTVRACGPTPPGSNDGLTCRGLSGRNCAQETPGHGANGRDAVSTPGGFVRVSGVEARVCADIAARQAMGVRKYGTTVEANQLPLRQWLQHAYEEALDLSVYLKRAMQELDAREDDGK